MRLILYFVLSFSTGCVCLKVKPQVSYLASFQFKKCQLRCLDIVTLETLPPEKCGESWPTDVIDLPLEMCDDVIGFKLETVAKEIKPQAWESLQCLKDKGCK
jgi:hypothetical protein